MPATSVIGKSFARMACFYSATRSPDAIRDREFPDCIRATDFQQRPERANVQAITGP